MERYNLLIEDDGVRILKTDTYLTFLQQNPGFPHENAGDFYSETSRRSLASRLSEILNSYGGLEKTLEIFQVVDSCDIPSDPGVKISTDNPDTENPAGFYDQLALFVIEKLITDYSKGSIAHSVRETIKGLGKHQKDRIRYPI